jgi:AcrR family transcriptional regulator
MTKTNDQGKRTTKGRGKGIASVARGEATRSAILRAAAELIGEEGWGAVTTRAIAKRAEVPHASVSYHFRGRDELLREAAIAATSEYFAAAKNLAAAAPDGLAGVLRMTAAAYSGMPLVQAGLATVFESTRQATRDSWLAERMAEILDGFLVDITRLIVADQDAGRIDAGIDPSILARVVTAAMDGLGLQAAFDPDVDLVAAADVFIRVLERAHV